MRLLLAFTILFYGLFSLNAKTKLLAWYKLDGNFKDSSGNNYDLKPLSDGNIFSDAPEIAPGKNLCFGPTVKNTKKYGAIGPEIPFNNKNGFTICGFVLLPANNSYSGTLFGSGVDNKGKSGSLLSISWGNVCSKVGKGQSFKFKRFSDMKWHHLTIVVPPESTKNEYSVYADGKFAYSAKMQYLKNYGKFSLGLLNIKQSQGVRIDEVKVFDGALDAQAIQAEAKFKGIKLTESQKIFYANKLTRKLQKLKLSIGPIQRIFPEKPVKIKGKLKIHFINQDWLCVVGNYNDFMRDRIRIECGDFLNKLDLKKIKVPKWSYDFYYNFNTVNIISSYRPTIKENFENPKYFTLKDSKGKKIAFAKNSYWINAVGLMRVPKYDGELKRTEAAAVAHFAYLRLAKPMKQGQNYSLTTQAGEKVDFCYDESKIISQTIKVNQIGYLPSAGRKIAYLGMWLAAEGPLKLDRWIGRTFYIARQKDNTIAYRGKIRLRMNEQYYTAKNKNIPLNGEQVCELDFSDFDKPGKYFIYIPGIGRSWGFELSKNAIGRAFYMHIRGLFHQRSGIAKGPPHTNWVMGADHMESYLARFSPEDTDYNGGLDKYGYLNPQGKSIRIDHFTVISENRTNIKLPNVHGGWWDAGDFDRRTYHFQIVQDLLTAYLMFPKKFKDGQQDIPESGNGIPDIIDEAAWGVEVWRRAQHTNGGVGCWIEATSHPKEHNPAKDKQRYYNALPTRHSSLQYAAHAGLLARAYKHCGQKDKSKLFYESAVRAFKYAMNSGNQIRYSWKHKVGKDKYELYSYVEPPKLSKSMVFKAALNLYELSLDKYYKQFLTNENFDFLLSELIYPRNPFFLSEIMISGKDFFSFKQSYKSLIVKEAQTWRGYQEKLAYRNLNFPPNHPYFATLGWGNAIPFKRGRLFIMAYRITGRYSFRNAALLLSDWIHGCNPMGRSLPTGVGKNYPIRILSDPSYSDGILPPLPGITPYTYTFYVAFKAFEMVFGLKYSARPDHYFNGVDLSLMPEALTKGKKLTYEQTRNIMDKMYPIWRRFANIEAYAVAQNEFTVWETIGPCAACLACLLPDNWMPPPEWKKEIPAKTLDELQGYLFQP